MKLQSMLMDNGATRFLNTTLSSRSHVVYPPPSNQTLPTSAPEVQCDEWRDLQHILFQLANLCFAISFLVPPTFRFQLFILRSVISLGSLLLVLWGSTIVCEIDVICWYCVFLAINVSYLSYLMYTLTPVKFPSQLQDIYNKLFLPFQVTRFQFKELVNQGHINQLSKGQTYAIEGATHAGEKISILISGKLKVTYEKVFLHHILPEQFVDSPEYEAVPPNSEDEDWFQVSIHAAEDSCLVTWPAKELHQFLKTRPFLNAVFTNIIGKDITHKLYQVQELLTAKPEEIREKNRKSRSSIVHIRHRLSMSVSSTSSVPRELKDLQSSAQYGGAPYHPSTASPVK